jgi:hypothetical protein
MKPWMTISAGMRSRPSLEKRPMPYGKTIRSILLDEGIVLVHELSQFLGR